MMKTLKRILGLGLLAVLCLVGGIVGLTTGSGKTEIKAEAEGNVTASIEYCTLAMQDNVYIVYAVKVENNITEPEMLIWTNEDGDYSENKAEVLPVFSKEVIQELGEEEYYTFVYNKLTAKQMTDNVYAQVKVDGVYSTMQKYSILQYAKNKIGNCEETLEDVLTNMLNYGASMQIYREYKTDRLANATFYSLTVVNGTLVDGTTSGLFTENETVYVTAPEEMDEKAFSCWKDKDGNVIDVTEGIKLTKDTILKAMYKGVSEDLEYTLIKDGAEYEVSGIGTCADIDIIIPDTYENVPVTSVGNEAFCYHQGYDRLGYPIESVSLPDTIKKIDEYAFYDCEKLKYVYVSENCDLETIGKSAFERNFSLKTFIVPKSMTTIQSDAFFACYSLIEIRNFSQLKIEGGGEDNGMVGCYAKHIDNGNGAYLHSESNGFVTYTDTDKNEYYIVDYKGENNKITVPSNINGKSYELCNYLFYKNNRLEEIVLAEGFTSIPSKTFIDCSALKKVVIPNSVNQIPINLFSGCASMEEITVPFVGTSKDVVFPVACLFGNTRYYFRPQGNDCVASYKNKTYYLPQTLKTINIMGEAKIAKDSSGNNSSMFSGCYTVDTITLGKNITLIEQYAFSGTSLDGLTIYFNGSCFEWQNIDKESYWSQMSCLKKVICTDEIIVIS